MLRFIEDNLNNNTLMINCLQKYFIYQTVEFLINKNLIF